MADNNSTIDMKDCGDYNHKWKKSYNTYVTHVTSGLMAKSTYNASDAMGISTFTSGGYIQFYPNPIMRGTTVMHTAGEGLQGSSNVVTALNPGTLLVGDNATIPAAQNANYYKYSYGRICSRGS